MAFTRKTSSTYWWSGVIREPDEDGTLVESSIRLKFKRIGQKEAQKFAGDVELLKGVILDWADYQDEAGKDIPFSKKELSDMLNDQFVAISMAQIYFDALQKARTGN
jgi:hypothetical protein